MAFQHAVKHAAKLRLALIGPAGSGKTYTALAIATALANGKRVAVVDTEHGSAEKYADLFDFDTLTPDLFSPQVYIDAIHDAEQAGYGVIILDSLSHAWSGTGGALELVDRAAKRSSSGNSFGAWREVTPLHNAMVDAIVGAKLHVIATMRTKTEYVQDKDDKGKTVIRKMGLQPVQRDGLEYEFDVVADLDQDNTLIVGKTRCPPLSGGVYPKAGANVAGILLAWLSGEPVAPTELDTLKQRLDILGTDTYGAKWTETKATALRVQAKQAGKSVNALDAADYRMLVSRLEHPNKQAESAAAQAAAAQ